MPVMARLPASLRHITAHRAIVATHDRALTDAADRVLVVQNGQLA
jgi:ABC-type lipoprotein export system ATPase subunit